jgi:hypothetical protein
MWGSESHKNDGRVRYHLLDVIIDHELDLSHLRRLRLPERLTATRMTHPGPGTPSQIRKGQLEPPYRDYCAIDNQDFFVRGCLEIPIIGRGTALK